MPTRGRLIIISSPSGGGKTSVIKHFLETHPNTVHSISYTTRPPRPGDVDKDYYRNVDRETFEKGIKEGMFAEWAEVHHHLYGTPKGPLEDFLNEGKNVLLDLDVIGGLNLKELYKDEAVSIFILPPSEEELKRRLSARATDSEEVQAIRLKNAIEEMTYQDRYDHRVINDDLEKACLRIEEIMKR